MAFLGTRLKEKLSHVRTLCSPGRLIRLYIKNKEGSISIEFAFVLPLLIAIYMGSIEFSHYLEAQRKMVRATRMISDIVGQQQSITRANLNELSDGIKALISPYPADDFTMIISLVGPSQKDPKQGAVIWSYRLGKGTGLQVRPVGSLVDMPGSGIVDLQASSVIFSESSLGYKSPVGLFIKGRFVISDKILNWPRLGTDLPCSDCS